MYVRNVWSIMASRIETMNDVIKDLDRQCKLIRIESSCAENWIYNEKNNILYCKLIDFLLENRKLPSVSEFIGWDNG